MPGWLKWKMTTYRVLRIAIVIVTLLFTAQGNADETPPPADRPNQTVSDAEGPSLEMLEFLADWEVDDEQWVGPGFFEQMAAPDEEQVHDVQND